METTQSVAWISFPDLKPTYFIKGTLFSLAFAVGKPIHLDMATLDKTKPSCTWVKVQVDIMVDLSKYMEIKIVNSIMNEVRVEKVKIQYDFSPNIVTDVCYRGVMSKNIGFCI